MSTHITLKNFEEIYNNTYNATSRYVICKCANLDDANDIIQNTYLELYSVLKRKGIIEINNITNYVIGIAKKKIIKHYGILYKFKMKDMHIEEDKELDIPDNLNIEDDFILKASSDQVWSYLKSKGDRVEKIFYLYYELELKIKEIAQELNLTESNVKNIIYRTIKELKKDLEKEGDIDE